jgi:hypothetical protein
VPACAPCKTPYVYDPVPLASADTIEGALQRGRGWAARLLLERPSTLADVRLVVDCVIHDARWDREIESRTRYYAELVARLNVPLEPLAEHVRVVADDPSRDDSDAWLARHVLELLAEQGLARAVAFVERLPDNDQLALDGPASRFPQLTWAAVDASLPTAELLAAATPRNRTELVAVLEARGDESDRAAMIEAALHGGSATQHAAYQALGRLGDERLVARAIAVFETHAADPERARTQSRERLGPSRYLEALGPELVLPLARRWFEAGFPRRLLAASILAVHAEPDDGPMALRALRDAWREGDMWRLCDCIEILTTAEHWQAADDIARIDTEVPYSYARRWTTDFLARAGVDAHRARLVDALWDCEDEAVLLALAHANGASAVRKRIAELATSPWHHAEIRAEARKWLSESRTVT